MLPPLLALAIIFAPPPASTTVCASCVKAHVEYLASPALNGRRCSTTDEAKAADYLIGELKASHVAGPLPDGGYLQTVALSTGKLAAPATLTIGSAPPMALGRDFVVPRGLRPISGPLVILTQASAPPSSVAGGVVFFDGALDRTASAALGKAGAKAVVTVAPKAMLDRWDDLAEAGPPTRMDDTAAAASAAPASILIRPEAAQAWRNAAGGTLVRLSAEFGEPSHSATHNVLGVIHGTAPDADRQAVLISAHYDHLGVRGGKLYPGANDDASGTAAVLEFARILKAGAPPKRSVYFALFGCEEAGGFGATYFDATPRFPSRTSRPTSSSR